MGRKRKSEENLAKSMKASERSEARMSPSKKKAKRPPQSDSDDSDMDDQHEIKLDPSVELDPSALPPREVLNKLLDRIESQLPKEDHVKYDSRLVARPITWGQLKHQ
jgi:hypothetical protein